MLKLCHHSVRVTYFRFVNIQQPCASCAHSAVCVYWLTAHYQETTESLSVPHLMCRWSEGTFTTARRCCDVFIILAPDTKLETDWLTDLLTYIQDVLVTVKFCVTSLSLESNKCNRWKPLNLVYRIEWMGHWTIDGMLDCRLCFNT